ncbi:MAG TPA: peptidase, partial [Firmicutes bacterium]|nr:peptidase [Bacillota bacterium]
MDRNKVISEIERKRGSKVISYFLGPNSKIAADAVEVLFKHLKIIGKVKNLDLYLHTTGGLLEIPLKIVYLMREFSEK